MWNWVFSRLFAWSYPWLFLFFLEFWGVESVAWNSFPLLLCYYCLPFLRFDRLRYLEIDSYEFSQVPKHTKKEEKPSISMDALSRFLHERSVVISSSWRLTWIHFKGFSSAGLTLSLTLGRWSDLELQVTRYGRFQSPSLTRHDLDICRLRTYHSHAKERKNMKTNLVNPPSSKYV